MADKTKLNKQEEEFAKNLFLGDSQIDSYRKAFKQSKNWKDNTVYVKASVLAKTDKVKIRLEELREKMSHKVEESSLKSATEVLNDIAEVIDKCMQRQPVMVGKGKDREQLKEFVEFKDGSEEELGVWKFDSSGALKGLELYGKHLKLFTDKVESVNVNHNLNEEVLTPEQRKSRIKELLYKNKNG